MVSARDGLIILYPEYFDKELTRSQGRRAPLKMCVKAPNATRVFHAARNAGFDPELDPEHHHPAHAYKRSGRVLISVDNVDGTKAGLVRVIARHLKDE